MKNRFQDVDFHDVDDFLEHLNGNEKKLVLRLRRLVFDCIPGVKEKLSYNVPFYSLKKRICFIWPPSVKWGNSKQSKVRFGFTSGNLLPDGEHYLSRDGRKQVYWKELETISDHDIEMLRMLLFQALENDRK